MTTLTTRDIEALQNLPSLSMDAQRIIDRAIIEAQFEIDRANAPKVFRSQTLTLLVEYENEDASGTQRLIVFQSDPNDDVKSVLDIVEADSADVGTVFGWATQRALDYLIPHELKPV